MFQKGIIITFFTLFLIACAGITKVPPPDVLAKVHLEKPPYYNQARLIGGKVIIFDVQLEPIRVTKFSSKIDLNNYLTKALPNINHYLKTKFSQNFVARYKHEIPEGFWEALNYDPAVSQDEKLHIQDLPLIHFGDPRLIVRDFDLYHKGEITNNMLTVVNPTAKWKNVHQQMMRKQSADYLLDITLAISEMNTVRAGAFDSKSEIFLGSKIKETYSTHLQGSGMPINVIVFQGMLYNKRGDVVRYGVEGFIPIWPLRGYIEVKDPLVHKNNLNTQIDHLKEFDQYPWKTALSSLLQNLIPY